MSTREADLEMLKRLVRFGDAPEGPIAALAASAPAPVSNGSGFSRADLLASIPQGEAFPMPGGKTLFVHPLSVEQAVWLNVQALREVEKLRLTDEKEAQIQRLMRAKLYQVIAACRTGPEPTAPQVFQPEDAEVLRRNPGWMGVVEGIVNLSDRLGENEDPQKALIADFFGRAAFFLRTCASQLSADSLESSQAALTRFASCVSAIATRGSVELSDMEGWG